jgi:hypothetical protein
MYNAPNNNEPNSTGTGRCIALLRLLSHGHKLHHVVLQRQCLVDAGGRARGIHRYCSRNSCSLIVPAVEHLMSALPELPRAVQAAGSSRPRTLAAGPHTQSWWPGPSQLRRIRNQLQRAHQKLPGGRLPGASQWQLWLKTALLGAATVPAAVGEPAAAATSSGTKARPTTTRRSRWTANSSRSTQWFAQLRAQAAYLQVTTST